MSQVVLVTGASSGIGAAIAWHLHQRGWRVYGTSRHPQAACEFPMLVMDVADDQSVRQAIDSLMERENRLNAVINCAGHALIGPMEETAPAEAREQMETNFWGVFRVCQTTLPIMRSQKAGLIVNISSLMGLFGLPFQALYSASKFALEGMTQAMRMEVKPFGIRVVLVEPGNYRTPLTDNRRYSQTTQQDSPYWAAYERTAGIVAADERRAQPPTSVAHLVERIMIDPNPRLRYAVGPVWERLAIPAKTLLSSRSFERIIMKLYGLS